MRALVAANGYGAVPSGAGKVPSQGAGNAVVDGKDVDVEVANKLMGANVFQAGGQGTDVRGLAAANGYGAVSSSTGKPLRPDTADAGASDPHVGGEAANDAMGASSFHPARKRTDVRALVAANGYGAVPSPTGKAPPLAATGETAVDHDVGREAANDAAGTNAFHPGRKGSDVRALVAANGYGAVPSPNGNAPSPRPTHTGGDTNSDGDEAADHGTRVRPLHPGRVSCGVAAGHSPSPET